ncbi:hypothetical protein B0H13DRAFT_2667964 [Mycena leptocephala]|nr:hypothetical protein B0H13DRAFT_2667964 [Mycena leptocephala]
MAVHQMRISTLRRQRTGHLHLLSSLRVGTIARAYRPVSQARRSLGTAPLDTKKNTRGAYLLPSRIPCLISAPPSASCRTQTLDTAHSKSPGFTKKKEEKTSSCPYALERRRAPGSPPLAHSSALAPPDPWLALATHPLLHPFCTTSSHRTTPQLEKDSEKSSPKPLQKQTRGTNEEKNTHFSTLNHARFALYTSTKFVFQTISGIQLASATEGPGGGTLSPAVAHDIACANPTTLEHASTTTPA